MRFALSLLLAVAAFGVALARHENGGAVAFPGASAKTAAEVYAKNCASCHGRDGRSKTVKGRLKHARDLADARWQDAVSDERIFNSVTNGKGKQMPAYGKKLSEQEIESLVGYVRGLRK